MANNIGLSLDIAVPFGFAGSIRAARAARVTMGRVNLQTYEAKAGSRIGGHTLLKHVGRTEAQLRERLRLEPEKKVVSSFVNLEEAEWAISETMRANVLQIHAWTKAAPNRVLTLRKDVARKVGYALVRKTDRLVDSSKVEVVLKYGAYNGMPYYILTAMLDK
ncbi:hypothetical protein OKW41_007644 [Paraburkholderia sp. UCT70]